MNNLRERNKNRISSLIILFGIGFMVIGYGRGEVAVFFKKAIVICLECIGIG
ncbi:MAG: CD1871A family CXXC motif-containing protein [Lachnospiraceae bacterium]|nr:CD1871A family CXXC motif-containing protein [Lachnospiraceae bacterium]